MRLMLKLKVKSRLELTRLGSSEAKSDCIRQRDGAYIGMSEMA